MSSTPGCGSGRLTEQLLERLPDGSAVALDGSASMLARRPAAWPASVDRVTFVRADLADPPLPIDGAVDAVMSTAAFHWVLDHDALFDGLALARSGRTVSSPSSAAAGATPRHSSMAARAEGHETAGGFHMADARRDDARA